MNTLHLKKATLSEMDFFLNLAKEEGWNPGINDAIPFYLTDPNGFFIAEFNGEKIGCISSVSYGDDFGFIGFYIVVPKYRGQGFGIKLWKKAMHHLDGCSIGLDGVVAQQENYKKSGFKLFYKNVRYSGKIKAKVFKDSELIDLKGIPIETILAYDKSIVGYDRTRFLIPWLEMPSAFSFGKWSQSQLIGYGTIRKCFEGYKIGPLFADSKEIAEQIFLYLISKIDQESFFVDIPEVNSEAQNFIHAFDLKKTFETARMYTKKPPSQCIKKIFGVTTFELG